MPKLQPNDEVLIYPYGGWHYHIKGCWMAAVDMHYTESNYIAVPFGEVNKKYKPMRMFKKYHPCGCVERYEKGLPLGNNPIRKQKEK